MKKGNYLSIGEAIREFLSVNDLSDKFTETEIYNRWDELAGRQINVRTKRVVFREGTLIVFLSSSVLRNELNLKKTEFLERINQRLRNNPVKQIEFK